MLILMQQKHKFIQTSKGNSRAGTFASARDCSQTGSRPSFYRACDNRNSGGCAAIKKRDNSYQILDIQFVTNLKLLKFAQPLKHHRFRFRPVLCLVHLRFHAPPAQAPVRFEVLPVVHFRLLFAHHTAVKVVRLANGHRGRHDPDLAPERVQLNVLARLRCVRSRTRNRRHRFLLPAGNRSSKRLSRSFCRFHLGRIVIPNPRAVADLVELEADRASRKRSVATFAVAHPVQCRMVGLVVVGDVVRTGGEVFRLGGFGHCATHQGTHGRTSQRDRFAGDGRSEAYPGLRGTLDDVVEAL